MRFCVLKMMIPETGIWKNVFKKNGAIVKYLVLSEAKQVFASKNRLKLPTVEELQLEIEEEPRTIEELGN